QAYAVALILPEGRGCQAHPTLATWRGWDTWGRCDSSWSRACSDAPQRGKRSASRSWGARAGSGCTLVTGARACVPGSIVGDSIRVARGTQVGRLFCRLVSGGAFGPGAAVGPTVGGGPVAGCRAITPPS